MLGGRRWEGREDVDKFRVRALAAVALCSFCWRSGEAVSLLSQKGHVDKVTHVFLEFTECKNGIPRSTVGNDPQAKRRETGEVAPENQFF